MSIKSCEVRSLLRTTHVLRRIVCAALACLTALLTACTILFDAPPAMVEARSEVAAKVMRDLTDASTAVSSKLKEAGTVRGPTTMATRAAGAMVSNAGHSVTTVSVNLTFEHVVADMPQLAVQGLEDAVVWVDEKEIGLGAMTQASRIGLVAPGHHRLRVECPHDPPFSADFYLEKDDRAVLQGQCSPGKAVAANIPPLTAAAKNRGSVASAPSSAPPVPPPSSSTGVRRMPTLAFEKTGDGDTPKLAMHGTGEAIVLLDGEKIGPNGSNEMPIRVGKHSLRVLYPMGAPFSADFFVENGDRAILCGNCAPGEDTHARGTSGGAPVFDRSHDAVPPSDSKVARDAAAPAATADDRLPQSGGKEPTLTFHWIGTDEAQLAIRNMGNSTIMIDGKRLGLGGAMGIDRMIALQPGSHSLEVIFPQGPPFTADFYLKAGERAVLRGPSRLPSRP